MRLFTHCCAEDLIGGAGFVVGLVVAWVMLLRVLRRRDLLKPVERLTLIQTAGVLAFFTMRSYPENSAALYSVDLLVLLPAMVFIAEADRKLRRMVPVRVGAPRYRLSRARGCTRAGVFADLAESVSQYKEIPFACG